RHLCTATAAGRADWDDGSENCGDCLGAPGPGVVGQSARFSTGAWAARRRLAAEQLVTEGQRRTGQQAVSLFTTIATSFPCVTAGGRPRFLPMGDAPTPGDRRRPACTETLPPLIASHQPHPLLQCGSGWCVPPAGGGSAAQDPLGLDIEGVDR